MQEILWGLGGFSVIMKSKYKNLYQLEEDIEKLYGSEDFCGLSGEDWFLLDKQTNRVTYLALTVPSYFFELTNDILDRINNLRSISLDTFIDKSASEIKMQDQAFFSQEDNLLLVSSDPSKIESSTQFTKDFHLLSNKKGNYQGYALYHATNHIYGFDKNLEPNSFYNCLDRMLNLCNEHLYELMDDEDEGSLDTLISLEQDCIELAKTDPRANEILQFVKNAKLTFYDIET